MVKINGSNVLAVKSKRSNKVVKCDGQMQALVSWVGAAHLGTPRAVQTTGQNSWSKQYVVTRISDAAGGPLALAEDPAVPVCRTDARDTAIYKVYIYGHLLYI